jgi:hypothetical protein
LELHLHHAVQLTLARTSLWVNTIALHTIESDRIADPEDFQALAMRMFQRDVITEIAALGNATVLLTVPSNGPDVDQGLDTSEHGIEAHTQVTVLSLLDRVFRSLPTRRRVTTAHQTTTGGSTSELPGLVVSPFSDSGFVSASTEAVSRDRLGSIQSPTGRSGSATSLDPCSISTSTRTRAPSLDNNSTEEPHSVRYNEFVNNENQDATSLAFDILTYQVPDPSMSLSISEADMRRTTEHGMRELGDDCPNPSAQSYPTDEMPAFSLDDVDYSSMYLNFSEEEP